MPPRFANVKFNLMRAIEIFQDLNCEDMDVSAPPSGRDFSKEVQVANALNESLTRMIEEGMFDDCDYREVQSSTDEETNESEVSDAESEGFDYECESNDGTSGGSFAGGFKRYMKRIMPKVIRRGTRSDKNDEEEADDDGDRINEQYSTSDGLENDICDKEVDSFISSHLSDDKHSEVKDSCVEEE